MNRPAVPLREQVQRQDRPPRQVLVPAPPRQQPQRPNGRASTTDDMLPKQRSAKYSSSIMNSSPDMFLYKQEALRQAQAEPTALAPPMEVVQQEKASPAPIVDDQSDMLRQGSDPTTISNISRQPSVPESSLTANGHHGASSIVSGMSNERNLPKQTSTAEEVMRDYLVGEGIKKAHFRALHPKAPKKKKTGFFSGLLSRSSKS